MRRCNIQQEWEKDRVEKMQKQYSARQSLRVFQISEGHLMEKEKTQYTEGNNKLW